jgi:hydroxymethylpyrimidine pyrophosphatase-like HAD family hydrolase
MAGFEVGVFDINGTIQDSTGIPPSVVDAFSALWSAGIQTTVATGRGFRRTQELLLNNFDYIISQTLPLIVENGARMVDRRGQNIVYHQLPPDIVDSAVSVIARRAEDIDYVAYYPCSSARPMEVWQAPNGDLDTLHARHGHNVEHFSGKIALLSERMTEDEPCMLIVKPKTSVSMVDEFTGANVEINEGELNVLDRGVHKGSGVADLATHLGVPLQHFIVGGNDHNDRSMLELSVGRSYFVGSNPVAFRDPSRIIFVASPDVLAEHLRVAAHA